jgi:LysM repeat protein
MNAKTFASIFVSTATLAVVSTSAIAQQTVPESLSILDEKVSRLQANVEDVQFRQQQMQKDLDKLKADVQELRRSGGGVSASDLQTLQARIDALDAARQKDKQAIIDQLAKELASLNMPRSGGKTVPATTGGSPTAEGKEHVVTKGETLTTIAKAYGVSVDDLKQANNISNPNELKVGQKLVIPK